MAPIKVFLTMVLATTLLAAPALAGGKDMNPCQMNPCQMKGGQKMMMHKGYMGEMMEMMKKTMGILKSINHTPSASQKKSLGKMMNRLDEMKESHEKMMKDCGMMKMKHKMRQGDNDY